jgi:hypothetical protein
MELSAISRQLCSRFHGLRGDEFCQRGRREGRSGMRKALFTIVATVIFVVLSGCQDRSAPMSGENYQRQVDEYDAQSKRSDEQLARSEKHLDQSDKQMERFNKLLQRWEQQADRYDKILDKWEEQPAPPQ